MAQHNEFGILGEQEACTYLSKGNYRILERNWHSGHLEVDIIAEWFGEIVFVEVKTRTNLSVGLPREYVTRQKQEKLRRTAACYLAARGLDCPVRFDVAEVYTDTAHSAAATRIEYLEDAF